MVNTSRLIHTLTVMLSSIVLAACDIEQDSELATKTLLYCSEGSPESFNPQLVTSGTTIDAVSQQLYNRLVKINPDTGQVESDIARKVIVSSDAMRYRFYLHKGIEFHSTDYFTPTRTLTSSDILFSFSRLLHEDNVFHKVGGGQYPFFEGIGLDDLIEQIIVVDDLTIEFRLSDPQASFLANLATDFAVILSEEYGQYLVEQGRPEAIDTQPIGTGPFKFSEYKRDHYIRYVKHEKYWQHDSALQQIIFDITPDNSTRLAKLLTKECDVLGYPSASDVGFLRGRPEINMIESTSMNVSYWAFNTEVEPFNNPKVRQALSYAVDRKAIIDAVYFGLAQPATSLLPPTSWAYSDTSYVNEFNLEKAKELLSEAGYPDGFEMDIWAMPVQRVYNPNAGKMAEIIQQNLAELDIEVNIVTYDWGTFRKKLAAGEHDSVLIGWLADNSDPDNFFRPLLSCAAALAGSNRSLWCNRDFDGFVKKALSITDTNQRKVSYQSAESIISNQVPLIPIAHASRYKVHRDYIKKVNINPYGGIDFSVTEKDLK
ncbi:ABC transporter substrate-binding protein [Psychrosphaera ytuae]|uniref:ABC transporter substrate-binding protein n=1 Tax=Psychrosphaera ytuae TaxID=2820710 RepID=A0A975HI85_9GAMM|nr:ABC transporter substrate-binding protein [Psychrosphaera ytuae]QTH63883.1 ABC transporter substrate-binding protein [Psychrosphaera ytuae]